MIEILWGYTILIKMFSIPIQNTQVAYNKGLANRSG